MVDLTRTVQIIFETVEAGPGFDGFGASVGKTITRVAGLGEAVVALEGALVALGLTLSAVSIKQAGEFSSSVREIGTLFNASAEDADEFGKEILAFATNSTRSLEDINKATFNAISSGVDYKESLDLLTITEKLSVAGRADLNIATLAVVSSLNAYGLSTDQAARFSDILFETAKQGQTDLSKLATSIGNVTAQASIAGVPFEDLGAAIAAITVAGIETSVAVTNLKSLLDNIIAPSAEAAKAAKALGLEFNQAGLESKGLEVFLKEIFDAVGGNVTKFKEFFGSQEAFTAALILGRDESGNFTKALEAVGNSTGAVSAGFALLEGNIENTITRIQNSIKILFIEIGKPLEDGFAASAEGIISVLNGLTKGIEAGALAELSDLLNNLSDQFKKDAEALADVLPEALAGVDFSDLVKSLELLANSVDDTLGGLFSDLDFSDALSVERFLQQIVDAIEALTKVTAGVVQSFKATFEAIGAIIDESSSLVDDVDDSVGRLLGFAIQMERFGFILGGSLSVLTQLKTDTKAVVDIISGSFKLSVNALGSSFDFVAEKANRLIAIIFRVFEATSFGDAAENAGKLAEAYEQAADIISQELAMNLNELDEAADQVARGFSGVTKEVGDTEQAVKDLGEETATAVAEVKKFGESATSLKSVESTAEAAKEQVEDLESGAKGAADGFKELSGETKEFTSGAGRAAGAVELINEQLTNTAKGTAIVAQSTGKGGTFSVLENEAFKVSEAIDSAAEATEQFKIALAGIEGEKAIAALEVQGVINVAQIRANADETIAIFEGISETVQSANDLIGETFAPLAELAAKGASGFTAGFRLLEKTIEAATNRANDLVEVQVEAAQAETDLLRARAARLREGDALINVQADGLEPELSLVLRRLIELTQIAATDEGLELLLGVP